MLMDAAAADDDALGAIMNEPFCAQYPGAPDRFTTLYASWTNRLDPLYHFYSISYLDSACPRASQTINTRSMGLHRPFEISRFYRGRGQRNPEV
jgi:hypothetical protein